MVRAIRTFVALAAAAALIFLGLWALFALIRFGSCSSGGTYVSTRECAPGTGLKIVELMASIFGTLFFAGLAATGGSRALLAILAVVPGAIASYFYVIAFAGPLGAGAPSSDKGPALIAGVVCSVIALPFLVGAIRPGRRGGPANQVVIDSPTGRVHIHTPEAGGPATIVRATRRPE